LKVHDVVNGMERRTSGASADERPLKANERLRLTEDFVSRVAAPNEISFRKLTIFVVLSFWVLQYIGLSLLFQLMNPAAASHAYLPRAVISALSALLSFGIVAVQGRLRSFGLASRAVAAALMALLCPMLMSLISRAVFALVFPDLARVDPTWADYLQDYLYRVWVFGSLSAIVLALFYAADVREREQRIVGLQALAHSAQLRALLNQLNPHFLFNALNSIAALMSNKRSREAEVMTENLADFLRATLALDPTKMITLKEELGLQRLYLDIEKVRFPDRLRISVDTPDDLARALVPSLITQPLIENSIKYGVARSTSAVDLNIVASALDGKLQILVEDDGGDARGLEVNGAQLGLANVAERLRAHYGEAAALEASPKPSGGFRNLMTLPLRIE
jgi:hypothetical protein